MKLKLRLVTSKPVAVVTNVSVVRDPSVLNIYCNRKCSGLGRRHNDGKDKRTMEDFKVIPGTTNWIAI